jgi:mannose-6-phosphate isomerase-like protein (cupin superfamily)
MPSCHAARAESTGPRCDWPQIPDNTDLSSGAFQSRLQLPGAEDSVSPFAETRLPSDPTVIAPDGSDVRVLLGLGGGGMAHFELAAGRTSRAVTHQTVEEIWYVLSGRGEMWRKQAEHEEIIRLEPGVCLTIPLGTHFQFRASSAGPVSILGVTMPPWPGEAEAVPVTGVWEPTV